MSACNRWCNLKSTTLKSIILYRCLPSFLTCSVYTVPRVIALAKAEAELEADGGLHPVTHSRMSAPSEASI